MQELSLTGRVRKGTEAFTVVLQEHIKHENRWAESHMSLYLHRDSEGSSRLTSHPIATKFWVPFQLEWTFLCGFSPGTTASPNSPIARTPLCVCVCVSPVMDLGFIQSVFLVNSKWLDDETFFNTALKFSHQKESDVTRRWRRRSERKVWVLLSKSSFC